MVPRRGSVTLAGNTVSKDSTAPVARDPTQRKLKSARHKLCEHCSGTGHVVLQERSTSHDSSAQQQQSDTKAFARKNSGHNTVPGLLHPATQFLSGNGAMPRPSGSPGPEQAVIKTSQSTVQGQAPTEATGTDNEFDGMNAAFDSMQRDPFVQRILAEIGMPVSNGYTPVSNDYTLVSNDYTPVGDTTTDLAFPASNPGETGPADQSAGAPPNPWDIHWSNFDPSLLDPTLALWEDNITSVVDNTTESLAFQGGRRTTSSQAVPLRPASKRPPEAVADSGAQARVGSINGPGRPASRAGEAPPSGTNAPDRKRPRTGDVPEGEPRPPARG
ncbi:hypothetical protein F4779DRAFT_370976 [Xylariaceae sp. FL0662B]|nr:hypothetical protein F4779DRAFT_370976 [Xylariaceae sp. FL0662B]